MVSASDYYPFGLPMRGRQFNEKNYRYGFNGKEKDKSFANSNTDYDYGFRIYDPSKGRFLSLDAYLRLSTSVSLYSYAGNSPITFIDKDGNFKFPSGLDYEKKYPVLSNYVKNVIKDIANNPKIMNELEKYTQMSKADIKKSFNLWTRTYD